MHIIGLCILIIVHSGTESPRMYWIVIVSLTESNTCLILSGSVAVVTWVNSSILGKMMIQISYILHTEHTCGSGGYLWIVELWTLLCQRGQCHHQQNLERYFSTWNILSSPWKCLSCWRTIWLMIAWSEECCKLS